MAIRENTHARPENNHLTRRQVLSGATAIGAMALPAVVLAEHAGQAAMADPHVAWWAEHQQIEVKVADVQTRIDAIEAIEPAKDAPDRRVWFERYLPLQGEREELWKQQWTLEERIAETAPTSPEGLAIVATVLLNWQSGVLGRHLEPDQQAGATLAHHILKMAPPEALIRAGLGG